MAAIMEDMVMGATSALLASAADSVPALVAPVVAPVVASLPLPGQPVAAEPSGIPPAQSLRSTQELWAQRGPLRVPGSVRPSLQRLDKPESSLDAEALQERQMHSAVRFQPQVHEELNTFLHLQRQASERMSRSSRRSEDFATEQDRDRTRLEEQLAKLKVESLQHMVSTVEYNLGELMHESRMIYFTNQQALHFSAERMPKVREALGLQEPKLVILLIPSILGRSYWKGRPKLRDFLPTKTVPELPGREEVVEKQMNVIAREVLLPVALQTRALVVGRSNCSLTNAFAEVSEPIQNSLGKSCPFQMVIFEHARNLHMNTILKPDSLERKLQQSSDVWNRANFVPALSHQYGVDPVLWPRHSLVEGASAYFIFECLNDQNPPLHDPRAAVQFENIFLSSLRSTLPVLALWTGGDVNVLKFEALNYVTNGIPLILLDSRWVEEAPDDGPGADAAPAEPAPASAPSSDHEPLDMIIMDVDEKTKEDVNDGFQQACSKLETHTRALNETGLFDTHTGSALACVKAGIRPKDKEKEQRNDRRLWLHEAIVRAMLESHHSTAPANLQHDASHEALSAEDEKIIRATDFFMDHVASQLWQEAVRNTGQLEVAIEALRDCQTWEDLETEWAERWSKLHYYAVFNGWDTAEAEGIQLLSGHRQNEFQASGLFRVQLNREELEKSMAYERAHEALKQELSRWLVEAKDYDNAKKRPEEMKSDKRLWLAAYEVLKSPDVYSCKLSEHRRLKILIQKLSRSDRLPDNSSLEGLLLLRCAWTLADVFHEKATKLKLLAKLSFAVLLLLGVVITFVTTSAWTADLSPDAKKFTVLSLGLASSSLAAWTTFTDPTKQWMKLRTASQRLQAEIWMFRTRVGQYGKADFTHISVGSDEGERKAEERFRDKIFMIADAALGPKDHFANHMTTDEVCIRVDGDKDKAEKVKMMNERLRANKLTSAHQRHKQYPELSGSEQQEHPSAERDSHHAPASPEEYIIWRLTPLRDFYGRRIPQVRRTRMLMQVLFMVSTSLTAVLAAADQTSWTPIVVSISAALSSWQEFRSVDMKLERYGAVVAALRNLMLWWQTLPEADKANVRHIEKLVGRCEIAASSELSAWLSDAQQARELVEKASAEERMQSAPGPDAKAANKK